LPILVNASGAYETLGLSRLSPARPTTGCLIIENANYECSTPRRDKHRLAQQIFNELKALNVRQVAYVPDAGHSTLITLCHANPSLRAVSLTAEKEGVALLGGAWLGGDRGVLLLQSSGVGNCINSCRCRPRRACRCS
jgi:hypothetical protein